MPRLCSLTDGALLAALTAWCAVAPGAAMAQSYHVRTQTSAVFSQRQRLDTSVEAPRLLNQSVELYGFDLLLTPDAPLEGRAAMRLRYDLATTQSAPFALDLLFVGWRPSPSLRLEAGRLWASSPLGLQDLDGARLSWTPTLTRRSRLSLSTFVGRDVQASSAPLAPTTFDAQGLPLQDDTRRPELALIANAQAALTAVDERLVVATAYQTRWRRDEALDHTVTGEERLAAAASIAPLKRHRLETLLAYNASIRRGEHVKAQYLWLGPKHSPARPSISVSASRRRPWFDASSIFNLFDPSPHDDLRLAASSSPRRQLRLGADLWGRAYHGDAGRAPDWFRPDERDARVLGLGLSQRSALALGSRRLRLTTRASHQRGVARSANYPRQWLLDQRAELDLPRLGPTLHARALLLRTASEGHPRRPDEAYALSSILGLDTRAFARARLTLQLEQRATNYGASSLNMYALLTFLTNRERPQ